MNYSKYPDYEARTPRAAFTNTLKKICNRLDRTGPQQLVYKLSFLRGKEFTATVDVIRLWVVGSYARGAADCGDLDLVAEIRGKEHAPPLAAVTKAFFGSYRHVRIYLGTPADSESGAEFEEAVLVWEQGINWAAAIDGIALDASATRFARAADAIPLRREQFKLSLEVVDELLDFRERGWLSWSFVPLSGVSSTFVPETSKEQHAFSYVGRQSANKKVLAPLVMNMARTLAATRGMGASIVLDSGTGVRAGGARICAEQLECSAERFDLLDCSVIAFIPALTTRGPNGFWVIERGPQHPLVQTFAAVQVWVVADTESSPPTQILFGARDSYDFTVDGVEVFASAAAARASEDAFAEQNEDYERAVPKSLVGNEVLELLAGADVVVPYNADSFALTRQGERYCVAAEEPSSILTPSQIAERLQRLLEVG